MKKKTIRSAVFLIIFSLFQLTSLVGQSTDASIRKGSDAMRSLEFQEAIKFYNEALKKETKTEALFNLPFCYMAIGDYPMAEEWFAKAIEHPEANAQIQYYFGLCLQANDKFEYALKQFLSYSGLQKNELRAGIIKKLSQSSFYNNVLNGGEYFQIFPLDNVNGPNDELVSFLGNNNLYFSADRDSTKTDSYSGSWLLKPYVSLYQMNHKILDFDSKEIEYGPVKPETSLGMVEHDVCMRFSENGTQCIFTQFGTNKAKRDLQNTILNNKIALKEKNDEGWSEVNLNLPCNSKDFSSMHPCFVPDADKIYFSSDRPGGFGGFDLYVMYYKNGQWSSPVNLGPEINTEGHEVYPFFSTDNKLYFSSDGHAGLGGFDIYHTSNEHGIWKPVSNMGGPVNSIKDDVAFVMDSSNTIAYLSSNRVPEKKMDIYVLKKVTLVSDVMIFDPNTGKGIPGATLESLCLPSEQSFISDDSGRIQLELPIDKDCLFRIKIEDQDDIEQFFSTKNYPIGSKLFFSVPTAQLNATHQLNLSVRDASNDHILSDAKVTLLNACTNKEVVLPIDNEGKCNAAIAQDCAYLLKIEREGYFIMTRTFKTNGLNQSTSFDFNIRMPRNAVPLTE